MTLSKQKQLRHVVARAKVFAHSWMCFVNTLRVLHETFENFVSAEVNVIILVKFGTKAKIDKIRGRLKRTRERTFCRD